MRLSFGKLSFVGLAVALGLAVGIIFKAGHREKPEVVRPTAAPERRAPGESRSGRPRVSVNSRQLNPAAVNELQSLEDLAVRDHDAAILKLQSLTDPELRPLALAAIATAWAKSDPDAAGAWVANLEPEEDALSAMPGLIAQWAASKPDDCLAWATDLTAGNLREVSLAELAGTWVAINPREALSRYLALAAEPGSERGLHVIAAQWALDAPVAAVDYFARSVDLPRREEFLETALVSLTNQDPALAWSRAATGFSDPQRILNVRAMALEAMAETQPAEAIQLAESVGNDPQLLKGIARGWASRDEKSTTTWIHSLQDPELEKSLVDEISRK